MKKEVSPAVIAAVIVAVVLVIGIFLYQKTSNNEPTPRPNPKFFGGATSNAPSKPQ